MGVARFGAKLRIGSPDRGDADLTLTAADIGTVQRFLTPLTADRLITLPTTGAYDGAEIPIQRGGLGPGKLNIGNIEQIPPFTAAAVIVRHNGTAWEKFWYNTHDDSVTFGRQGTNARFAAWGDGDPGKLMDDFAKQNNTVAFPTNTTWGTGVARCVKFRLPMNLNLTAVRMFSLAALAAASGYQFAIYPAVAGSARLWQALQQPTLANAWMSVTANLPVTLVANTDYWFCAAPAATGTTVAFRTMDPPFHGAIFGADAEPLGGKLNLGIPVLAQFAITAGAWPTTLPAIAAAAYLTPGTSGGMVPVWLEGTAS